MHEDPGVLLNRCPAPSEQPVHVFASRSLSVRENITDKSPTENLAKTQADCIIIRRDVQKVYVTCAMKGFGWIFLIPHFSIFYSTLPSMHCTTKLTRQKK